tara:strand:+ start:478 stop:738 length:261 start_codon:yes stop_codon:yes gene_type:complete
VKTGLWSSALRQIRLREITALVDQLQPIGPRAGIGKAIPEVQIGRMSGDLVLFRRRLKCTISDAAGDRDIACSQFFHERCDQPGAS